MSDIPNVKKWILEYLPKELQDALRKKLKSTTTEGRKTAIEKDNVNDFAVHGAQKKILWKHNGFYQEIKTDDGNKLEPIRYAYRKKAYKCYAYMFIYLKERVHSIEIIFKNRNELPYWYSLLLFSKEPKSDIHQKQYFDEAMYDLLFNSPKSEGLYNVNGFLEEVGNYIKKLDDNAQKYFAKKDYKFKRSQIDEQKDIEFYHNISKKKKNQKLLKKLVYKERAFDLRLDQCIMEEGDLDSIFFGFRPYQFCEYIVKTKKFDDFLNWIKSNKAEIKYETCCHMIMPQFRQLYPIICFFDYDKNGETINCIRRQYGGY